MELTLLTMFSEYFSTYLNYSFTLFNNFCLICMMFDL